MPQSRNFWFAPLVLQLAVIPYRMDQSSLACCCTHFDLRLIASAVVPMVRKHLPGTKCLIRALFDAWEGRIKFGRELQIVVSNDINLTAPDSQRTLYSTTNLNHRGNRRAVAACFWSTEQTAKRTQKNNPARTRLVSPSKSTVKYSTQYFARRPD
jgi:hypothetical protein